MVKGSVGEGHILDLVRNSGVGKAFVLQPGEQGTLKNKHKPRETEKNGKVLLTGPAEGKNPESVVLSSQVDTVDDLSLGFLPLLPLLLLSVADVDCP